MSSPFVSADFYSADTYCQQQSIGLLVRRVMLSITNQADQRLEVHGLTHAQWGPLFWLQRARDHSLTVAELAREMNTDAGAMTRMLDRLEKKGLCRRIRSTDDRRVVRVVLTDEGMACALMVPQVLSEVMNGHLAGFNEAEWHTLLEYLNRIVANGDAMRQLAPAAPASE